MRITKYQHACVVLEDQGERLVIDPGIYTPTFGGLENIKAVVITHKHADHFDPQHIREIIQSNPDVRIFSVEQVAESLQMPNVVVVRQGDEHTIGSFRLSFVGSMHAGVHTDWPTTVQNIGVSVNDIFYYAGDSLALPSRPVQILAVPVSYAWVKMSEAMDFVATVKPASCFLTHDNPLSEFGVRTAAGWITKVCEKHDIDFHELKSGESLEV
jgi:L-ascorbate metabolism protein UlaG (beta-lactamase superfamily)